MSAMAPALSTHHLTKIFGSVTAIQDLDLSIPKLGVSAFLGPNGSGKSTTIRLLLGLLKPTSGSCEVLGRPAGDLKALARIGAMVENPSLYPHLTGRENLRIQATIRQCPKTSVQACLDLVGLRDAADRPCKGYSLGMKQRLGLAMALIHEPELLILDEPTNGLDPGGIREMRELIRELPFRTGTTVFLCSHLLAEVEQVADHVVILAKGRMRFQGTLDQLRAHCGSWVEVQCSDPQRAFVLLQAEGFCVQALDEILQIEGDRQTLARVAEVLVRHGISIYGLKVKGAGVEDAFLHLTTLDA